MKKETKALLAKLLEDEVIVLSWGITNIQISVSCVSFDVNGFKYKGTVSIELDNEGYRIVLKDKTVNSSLDDIVTVLDNEIEKTGNYISDIINTTKKSSPLRLD